MADNAKWYVAHTYSGYENAVKTAIEKFVANRHLEDKIFDIRVPLETVTEVTDSGEVKEVERKVFRVQNVVVHRADKGKMPGVSLIFYVRRHCPRGV